ncbi:unnamed protein product [Orchesella dallaii]|uniref:Uncharacterized protein n=1 Tax=Orchesella dallaii TaxID=48710 RepID=A0ABP1RBV7_9HEXA
MHLLYPVSSFFFAFTVHNYTFRIVSVVLGLIWIIATADCVQFRRKQDRKLHSSPEPDLDDNFSNEDLHKLLTLLEGTSKEAIATNGDNSNKKSSTLEHTATMIMPELMRIRPQSLTTTTTTPNPPVSRFTTRRFYRRLRRKTTTSTEAPLMPSSSSTERFYQTSVASAESPRMLQSGPSPSDLLQQLSLLNGILGALNSSAAAPTANPTPVATNNANDNSNNNNAKPVPDLLALFAGAKNVGAASSNHETVVAPPPSPTTGQVEDPTAALALLNLFSGGNGQKQDTSSSSGNNAASSAAANLLSLMGQSQNGQQPSQTPAVDNDAAAALTKFLLQSSAGAPTMQGNSIAQPQNQNTDASVNQLNSLLGLLGTLGGAAQQSPAQTGGGINNLFNLGGDQMAQAQTNSLATLFGSQQQQSQQSQAQNLLNLFGGNQGGQGLSLASLLAPQAANSIPGLGLLSTVSSLGSSIFSTVSNLFGGSGGGKPRVRGVDTRVGLGYRLGNVGDAQVVWEIGPQLYTDPLRNEARPYTKKRESGLPSPSHYFQPASTTAAEKEMQQIEAKRRMVQAAIQDHYRGNHFQSVYPKPPPTQRRRSHLDYNHFDSLYPASKPQPSPTTTPPPSSSSLLSSLPFGDHLRGFWSGITSGIMGSEDDDATSHFNFDDVRNDFSNNLMKRSSPDYTDYESRASHPRRLEEDLDDPTHSTLTEYERMLLSYGKDVGVANTNHGVVEEEPESNESQSFFSRWFKGSSSTSSKTKAPSQSPHANSEWGMGSASNEYPTRSPSSTPPRSRTNPTLRQQSQPSAASPYGPDLSFIRRNDSPSRANQQRRNGGGKRPQKRRSHNPFRNWFSAFKSSGQRPRHGNHQTGGFGRRHFKRPSASNNPKLQHFTNTNKDLMMADANNDDFVESAGIETYPISGYQHPLAYEYANEFPDVPLTPPPRRLRPSQGLNKVRASLTQRERVVEPALLYDHLEASDDVVTEADESFHNRNKVVVDARLREREKQKVLEATKTSLSKATSTALTKAQRLSILKARNNATRLAMEAVKQRVIVKNRGTTKHKPKVQSNNEESVSESTTILPSMLSTISSIFKGTTKPKLFNNLLHNATSFLPSIRILPRKKNKESSIKTKLTFQNGKPAVIVPLNHDDDDGDDVDDDMEAAADEAEPVVQVGHDMSFTDLQTLFGSGTKNSTKTKRRRFRIRVKESVLKGDGENKERKDADEDDQDKDDMKDIFVDIESGEVSVLKPVASLVSFSPKKEEASDEEETDYYEDDDGDGVPDADMKRKEHIFDAIQTQLVSNFEKMRKAQLKAEAKKRRKQELAEKGMDESMDVVTKFFDIHQSSDSSKSESPKKIKHVGGLSLIK